MRNIICLIILFSCQLINAQKHDKSWVIGYNNNRHPTHKGTLMTFNNNNMMTMSPRLVETNVGIGSNTSICDSSGNLAFFSNGYTIWNKNSEVIHERLVFSNWFNDVTYGNYLACSNLFLPMPNQPNQYVLLSLTPSTNEFHFKDIPIYVAADSLQYTILDATGNGGRGTVSSLKQMLFVDTLDSEGVSACRHANGRDWWIFAAEDASNRFYRYLLDPRGIRYHGEQRIGDSVNYKYSFAHTVFSPNGEWWIRRRANSYGNGVGYDIYLYRFDRCNGQLYNPIHLQYPTDTSTGGGVAISPNSRYLYVTTNKIIHQYDLQAANIAMSKQTIGVWDGFADTLGWQTKFLYMQLAPDNKIYISTVPTTKFLHVIHAPDSAGVA
jgi:hypothetical protein